MVLDAIFVKDGTQGRHVERGEEEGAKDLTLGDPTHGGRGRGVASQIN